MPCPSRSGGRISVHPRARGEHLWPRCRPWVAVGSSPRTRGTCGRAGRPPLYHRFIPAHAGNMRRCSEPPADRSVHPRARGEHVVDHGLIHQHVGSSPRTRGTSQLVIRPAIHLRFIPAHAGNMSRYIADQQARAVHPRARGEHYQSVFSQGSSAGSSPRTRGTFHPEVRDRADLRFIPAHAGNISMATAGPIAASVHPRARGEHS